MSKPSKYSDGAPAWAELAVSDLDGAKEFYGELFGWTFDTDESSPRRYTDARQNGAKIAGLTQIPAGSGQPTVWVTYLAAADLAASVARAVELGATVVVPPFEVPNRGRAAILRDATGAAVGLWEAGAHIGAELINELGATCWHEVLTNDLDGADAFYTNLFPFDLHVVDDQTTILKLDGGPVGGRRKIGENLQGIVPPHWQSYFWVDDTDKAVARIKELGGKVRFGPVNTPHGPLAGVTDPFGAHFTVIVPTEW
jgi:predicted enzyme related to lactoylglutathione lyase